MAGPTSVVLRVMGSSGKQLVRPRGSRGGHTGHQEAQVSNGKRIWFAGKILLHLTFTEISLLLLNQVKWLQVLGSGWCSLATGSRGTSWATTVW